MGAKYLKNEYYIRTAEDEYALKEGSGGERILSSRAFTIEMEPGMRNEDVIESSNEMTYLDSKIQEHIDHMLETKQKLEEAFELIKKELFPEQSAVQSCPRQAER